MNRPTSLAFVLILATVALDAIGIGLIAPILPQLLKSLGLERSLALHVGAMTALYALMQFLCAPALGALSDRFGRRPVLLLSLAGGVLDYLLMACAPWLSLLYLGRVISGISGASASVAGAYIADISDESQRAQRFGLMGACFGVGLIGGPVIGGLLGAMWLRAPFVAAAALAAINLSLAWFALPEPERVRAPAIAWRELVPWTALRDLSKLPSLAPLLRIYVAMQLAGQVPGTLWALYGNDRFGWDATSVGLSLAAFGILHALFQGVVTGRASQRFGAPRALLAAIASDAAGYVVFAFARSRRTVAPGLLLAAAGGIGVPTVQSMASAQTDEDRQGALQGVLASLNSLAAVIGPLLFGAIYVVSAGHWDGWVWIVGAALYLPCIPVLRAVLRKPASLQAVAADA
ncbi:MAG: Tet(A)/Tet(B)/Tet(C) family tetracycline efflux MFS transporter [Lysobacter sp.]